MSSDAPDNDPIGWTKTTNETNNGPLLPSSNGPNPTNNGERLAVPALEDQSTVPVPGDLNTAKTTFIPREVENWAKLSTSCVDASICLFHSNKQQ